MQVSLNDIDVGNCQIEYSSFSKQVLIYDHKGTIQFVNMSRKQERTQRILDAEDLQIDLLKFNVSGLRLAVGASWKTIGAENMNQVRIYKFSHDGNDLDLMATVEYP